MEKTEEYRIWCKKVLFIVQLAVLVSMVITSIANIVCKTGNLPLWTALLGSTLGFILPTPKFPSHKVGEKNTSSPNTSIPSSIVI